MELEFDKDIYITSHKLFPNVPEDEDLRETHRMGVLMNAINTEDFEYKGDEKQTKEAYLKHLVFKGAEKKYDHVSEIAERLDIELELVFKNGWTDYFLATHKLVQNAKRLANAFIYQFFSNSGTNSLICYCLGFHYCDPIKYGLCYERFFYSRDLSLAIVMGEQGGDLKRFSKILRNRLVHFSEKGEKIVDPNRLRPFAKTYYKFREWESAEHISLGHWNNQVKKVHALCKEVKKQYGEVINPNTISTYNQKTLELFQRGDMKGVYQNASEDKWAKEALVEFHPDSFYDLVAINSFFRPGVYDRMKLFINHKKNHNSRFSSLIKDLFVNPSNLEASIPIQNAENSHLFECDDVLFETYGVIIYQEQMMRLVQLIANFTAEASHKLHIALWKKDKVKLKEYEKEFMKQGKEKGNTIKGLKSIWKEWEENSVHYYSKGGAVSKTLNFFQIAYFKAHYRKAFDEVCKKVW